LGELILIDSGAGWSVDQIQGNIERLGFDSSKLFGQDLHGPILKEFGSDLSRWNLSTQELLKLDADILCEGHFGVYRSKKEVTNYLRSLRIQYKVE
jgi:glyoxylase-like metal-dependent hydrolase (beta-lactamase superfamily II)